jgi:hypothetical protein
VRLPAGEEELAIGQLRDDCEGPIAERDATFAPRLHSFAGNGPETFVQINLRPARTDRFASPRRRQDRELERSSRHSRLSPKIDHEFGHCRVRDRLMMTASQLGERLDDDDGLRLLNLAVKRLRPIGAGVMPVDLSMSGNVISTPGLRANLHACSRLAVPPRPAGPEIEVVERARDFEHPCTPSATSNLPPVGCVPRWLRWPVEIGSVSRLHPRFGVAPILEPCPSGNPRASPIPARIGQVSHWRALPYTHL